MSVINKMLRDLDSRAREPGLLSNGQVAPAAVTRGTASVINLPLGKASARPGNSQLVLLVLVLVVVAGALWLIGPIDAMPTRTQSGAPKDAGQVKQRTVEPLPMHGAASAALAAAPGPLPNDAIVAPARDPVQAPLPARVLQQRIAALRDPQNVVQAAPVSAPFAPSVPAVSSTSSTSSAAVPEARRTPAPAAGTAALVAAPVQAAPSPVRWQEAAMETVSQAQRLWAAGARDAALELLHQAMPMMERSHGPELAGTGAAATLAMLRELARMELAQGQPEAVLALLQRHERLLAGRADLWALRANAAQRVGQHSEASQAYRTALKIRPAEARWMLGAAVSLAALGQLTEAAEMADQARAMEDVNPEILAYLRQLGVRLRDR